MARKKRSPEREALIKQLIAEYQPKTAQDAHDTVKDLLGDMIQGLLEGELDEELGYSIKHRNHHCIYVGRCIRSCSYAN